MQALRHSGGLAIRMVEIRIMREWLKPVASGRLAYDLKHRLPRVLAGCQRISDDLIAFARSRAPVDDELDEAA